MRRPTYHADNEHHTKQQTSSWIIVNTPAATASVIACMREGRQYSPMAISARSMAKLQKNITIGLPRRMLSFSFMF